MSRGAEKFLWIIGAELGLEPNFQFPTQFCLHSILSPILYHCDPEDSINNNHGIARFTPTCFTYMLS